MLVDRYEAEDVFSRVPRMAARIDAVLSKLDQLLDDDELYQQVRTDFGKRHRFTLVHGRHSTPVEVLLRMLICQQPASVELSANRGAGGPEPDPALVLSAVLGIEHAILKHNKEELIDLQSMRGRKEATSSLQAAIRLDSSSGRRASFHLSALTWKLRKIAQLG